MILQDFDFNWVVWKASCGQLDVLFDEASHSRSTLPREAYNVLFPFYLCDYWGSEDIIYWACMMAMIKFACFIPLTSRQIKVFPLLTSTLQMTWVVVNNKNQCAFISSKHVTRPVHWCSYISKTWESSMALWKLYSAIKNRSNYGLSM